MEFPGFPRNLGAANRNRFFLVNSWSPHVRISKTVLDSGFHTVDSTFQGAGFPWEVFRIPKPSILDFTSKVFPDIPFHAWVISALGKEKSSHNNDNAGRVWSTAVWYITWQVFFLGSKTTTLLYRLQFSLWAKRTWYDSQNSNKTSWVIFGPYIILQVYM